MNSFNVALCYILYHSSSFDMIAFLHFHFVYIFVHFMVCCMLSGLHFTCIWPPSCMLVHSYALRDNQVRSWAQHQGDRRHILGKQDALPSNQQHKGQAPGMDAQVTRMKLHAQGRRLHAQCPWIHVQCTSMNHNAFGCRTIQMPLSASGLQNAVHDFMHL